jgi:DNA-directed RNA polymerase III subunit RPC3
MMELKDCRSILSSLSSMCLIETQDVPKSAVRTRTGTGQAYHLWQVDVQKVYSFLITTMYKTLGNLLQREEKEIADRAALLEKMQRSDVTGRDMLQQREQNELAELDKALVKLRLAKMRTELNVMILRDLPGGPAGVRFVATRSFHLC